MTGPGVLFPIHFPQPLQYRGSQNIPSCLSSSAALVPVSNTWVSALCCALLTKLSEISLANVLPRNELKIFQKQLEAFLKYSRSEVRAEWGRSQVS